MRLCFIADGRSIIARNWIRYFTERHEVHVISTCPCSTDSFRGATLHPIAGEAASPRGISLSQTLNLDPYRPLGRALGWGWDNIALPLKILRLAGKLRTTVRAVCPDLVHALRIPIEGELLVFSGFRPRIVSVWGNDFTLFACRSMPHGFLTAKLLPTLQGLLADCEVDVHRAREMGLCAGAMTAVMPGGGGISPQNVGDVRATPPDRYCSAWNGRRPVVLNPRGYRQYVRNHTFLTAIPRILKTFPSCQFVCVGLRGWKPAETLASRPEMHGAVVLKGVLGQEEMIELFCRADVSVSPAEHDGTPNTLLEAMACGSFPVCGDLPSIREWIRPGENGFLFDPRNPDQLAEAVIRILGDGELRARASAINRNLVMQRADYDVCMRQAEAFYEEVSKVWRQRMAT